MMLDRKSIVVACVCVLYIFLCMGCSTDEGCRQKRDSLLGVTLYEVVFNQSMEQYENIVTAQPLQVIPLGTDSIYEYGMLRQLSLPLRRVEGDTSFKLFNTETGVSDTLTVVYSVSDAFLSLECGCISSFELASAQVTHHSIDSAVVVESSISTVQANNLNLYFRNNSSN